MLRNLAKDCGETKICLAWICVVMWLGLVPWFLWLSQKMWTNGLCMLTSMLMNGIHLWVQRMEQVQIMASCEFLMYDPILIGLRRKIWYEASHNRLWSHSWLHGSQSHIFFIFHSMGSLISKPFGANFTPSSWFFTFFFNVLFYTLWSFGVKFSNIVE